MKSLRRVGRATLFACVAEILERATEKFAFGEDGKGGGAGDAEGFGEGGRVEGIADDAARR